MTPYKRSFTDRKMEARAPTSPIYRDQEARRRDRALERAAVLEGMLASAKRGNDPSLRPDAPGVSARVGGRTETYSPFSGASAAQRGEGPAQLFGTSAIVNALPYGLVREAAETAPRFRPEATAARSRIRR